MVDTIGLANSAPTATTLQYNGRQARQLNGVGFAGATAARPLGAFTGVRPGTTPTTVTATPTTWTCAPFAGLADLMTANESGPYPFSFDAIASGTMTPSNASNPRIDIVYVTITDPENGSTTPTVTRGYLAGVANTIPAAPAAPAQSFAIAQILVPKTGAGSPSVTWVAPYAVAAGAPAQFNTLAQLSAWTTANPWQHATVINDSVPTNNGDYVFNPATSQWDFTGIIEAILTPATGWTAGTGTNVPRIKRQGKQVTLYGSLAWAGGGAYSALFTAPSAFLPTNLAVQRQIGLCAQLTGAGLIAFLAVLNTSGIVGNGTGATGSLPASGAVHLNGLTWWID
jgi:hypothetical protein